MRSFSVGLLTLLSALISALIFSLLKGQSAPITFNDLQPIFQDRCIICHNGPAAPKQLQLTSYSLIMKGSENGTVVKPGDPANSELVKRIKGISLPRMPLTGPPWLSDEQVSLIEGWIAAGAPEHTGNSVDSTPRKAAPKQGSLPVENPASVAIPEQVTYADVQNIFLMRCVKCHTDRGLMGNPPEELRLDSYKNILSTADRARVVPGSPDASELVRRIRGQARPRMPFDGPPFLTENETRLIVKWIEQGARDPNGKPAPVPIGARIRLHGIFDGSGALDGLPIKIGRNTRIKKSPRAGDYVRVRGRIGNAGEILVDRIRRR